MSGLLYYKSMLIANTAVSLDMNKDIKIARSGNTTDRQDEITAYPIEYEEISIFNPTAGFAAFLIPAVLVLIIQQTLLLESALLPEQPAKTTVSKTLYLSTGITTEHYELYSVKD